MRISELPPPMDRSPEPPTKLERREGIIGGLLAVADAEMIGLHGRNEEEEGKPFHNIEHPHRMRERAERLCSIFGLTPEQKEVVDIAIAYHDVDILFKPADPQKIDGMITRYRGAKTGDQPQGAEGNEALSAARAVRAMRKAAIFTDEQIHLVEEAIHATYPDARFGQPFEGYAALPAIQASNSEAAVTQLHGTMESLAAHGVATGPLIYQPHLESALENGKIPLEILVVALTDLGHPGIDASTDFERQGDSELRELKPNIAIHIGRLVNGQEPADKIDRETAGASMLNWLKDQRGFVMFQMLRFEKIVMLLRKEGRLDDEKEAALRKEFSHYADNVQQAIKREKEVADIYAEEKEFDEQIAFTHLAKELGYDTEQREIKMKATRAVLDRMQGVLNGTNTVIFGSIAKYLHGHAYNLPELQQTPPGDFDAVVPTENDLRDLRRRLQHLPEVTFNHEEEIVTLPDGAKRLSGSIRVELNTTHGSTIIEYPFEFFTSSNIAIPELTAHTVTIEGFKTLNREALHNQYLKTLDRESRINAAVQKITALLNDPETRTELSRSPLTEEGQELLKKLELDKNEVDAFYVIEDQLRKASKISDEMRAALAAKQTRILSGMHIKLSQRKQSLHELGTDYSLASDDNA